MEYTPFLPVYLLLGFVFFCGLFLLASEFKQLAQIFRSDDS